MSVSVPGVVFASGLPCVFHSPVICRLPRLPRAFIALAVIPGGALAVAAGSALALASRAVTVVAGSAMTFFTRALALIPGALAFFSRALALISGALAVVAF